MGKKGWSRKVTEKSNALDLEAGVFTQRDPHAIALSLKRSAEHSTRRKSDPYRSAMSVWSSELRVKSSETGNFLHLNS